MTFYTQGLDCIDICVWNVTNGADRHEPSGHHNITIGIKIFSYSNHFDGLVQDNSNSSA